jgi:hypothetical protein
MAEVAAAIAFRQERLDRLATQRPALVAKELLGRKFE